MSKKSIAGLICLCSVMFQANGAAFLFDTASPPTTSSGSRLHDTSWVFHRFEVSATTHVDTIGGDFTNFTPNDLVVFGAIIKLLGDFDNPSPFDLTTNDVLATASIPVAKETRGLNTAPVDLVLSPGWYALEFGTGALSASSVGSTGLNVMMQYFENDLAPLQASVAVLQSASGDVTITPQREDFGVPRFYVTGTVVPVPAAAWLFVSGLMGLMVLARRKKG